MTRPPRCDGQLEPFPIAHRDLIALAREIMGRGRCFRFRAHGASMLPFIRPGDLLTVQLLEGRGPRVGDVILYQVAGQRLIAHRVIGGKGAAFGPGMPSSALCRPSFRRTDLISFREVERREEWDRIPDKPDLVGWVSAANPPFGQPVAFPSHREGTVARGSKMRRWNIAACSHAGAGKPDMLRVCGDRLWAPLEFVHPEQVLGRVVAIERDGRAYRIARAGHRLAALTWVALRPFVRAARSRLGKLKRRILCGSIT